MAIEAELALAAESGGLKISRRSFAAGLPVTAFLASCSQPSDPTKSAGRPDAPADPGFLALSIALTGHHDLDGVIAARTSQAFRQLFLDLAVKIPALTSLAKRNGSPKILLAAATSAGAGDAALAIVAAWYTGTVGTGQSAQAIAYADALMNRPVSDGVFLPTYQMGGPGWWTAEPPTIRRSPESPATPCGAVGCRPCVRPSTKS